MLDIAVVFAGGQSRRMGHDKLLLPRAKGDEKTVLHHVLHTAEQIAEVVLLLAPKSPSLQYEAILNAFKAVRVNHDQTPYQGPLQALGQAIAPSDAASYATWAFLAGDIPGIQGLVLQRCEHRLVEVPSSEAVLIAREHRPQALLGCYRYSAVSYMIQRAALGEQRLMPILQHLSMETIDVHHTDWPDWWTRPVHTREDYETWCEWRVSREGEGDSR